MNCLKIAFVGLGSIGTRHLKNTYKYLKNFNVHFEIDVYRSNLERELPDNIVSLISRQLLVDEDIDDSSVYDALFITNPTSLHFETLVKFQNHAKCFFIEKPVFSRTDVDLSLLSKIHSQNCYVACPLRYNSVIEYVKDNINVSDVLSIKAVSSSYLPDWRPGTDYRKCYSAHTDMGGGVDIDLIHEWDYITHIFGDMDYGFCISDKISDLEIDSNDIAIYIAKNKHITVELHLDYFGRVNQRTVELFTKDDTVKCDILNGEILFSNSNTLIKLESERNDYQMKEIEHFFKIVFSETESDSTVEHALKVLKYAKGNFSIK